VEVSVIMRALEPEVVDAGRRSRLCSQCVTTTIRSDVIDPGCRIGCVSGGVLIRLVTGALWIDGSTGLGRERGF
jgi:hypothetical protein